jgi:hypothetical protein
MFMFKENTDCKQVQAYQNIGRHLSFKARIVNKFMLKKIEGFVE